MTASLRPRLVLVQGGEAVAAREIGPGEEWTLGRGADTPVPVQERSVSRAHARVYCDAGGVHLEDLGTPNGTFVDGERLHGTLTLRDGSLVRLGQSTNPDPILLRFEDPGARLLEAMVALPAPRAEPPPSEPGEGAEALTVAVPPAADAAMTPFGPVSAPPRGEEPDPALAEAAPGGPEGEDAPIHEAPSSRARALLGSLPGRLGWHAAFWVAGLALVVWGFVALLQSTQKPWQSVRVEPQQARAGGRVSIRGVEVEPAESLTVFVDGVPASIDEMVPGQVVFTVPALPASEAGVRAVPLRVERKGIVLLRQNIHYETRPAVEAIRPAEAAVGDTVTLEGGGFAAKPSRVKVLVNQVPAAVVSASPERLEFRVPVITRGPTLDGTVEVRVGEWEAAPATLVVRAREAPCYALTFEARGVTDRIWEVRHPLGPALYVEGPPGAGAPPARVTRAVDRLNAVFVEASSNAGVRFEVRESRPPALQAIGMGARPTEIASWSSRLDDYLREQVPELRHTQLLPFWNAVVLNELVEVFARKQPPRFLPGDHPLRQALERIQRLNFETGGQGCPSEAEIATLSTDERGAFEAAPLRVPRRFGEVGGTWEGTFEDVFSETPSQTRLELRLELEQAGTSLTGRAFFFEVRGPGIRWSPPPVEGIEGRVRLGAETKVELKLPPQPPHHLTRLSGVLVQDALTGTYRTSRNKEGAFQLANTGE